MPSIYAHYEFGQRVVEDLPYAMRKCIACARPHFDLGLQGPDFFYFGSVYRNQVALDFGEFLHEEPMRCTLETILQGFDLKPDTERGGLSMEHSAYLMGLIGHFTLDSIVHPYVYEIQGSMANHLALETDFDSFLLRESGRVPWEFPMGKLCPTDQSVLRTVSEVYAYWYKVITPGRVMSCITDFHYLRSRMCTPTPLGYSFIKGIMKVFGIYEAYRGMLMPPDTDDHPGGVNWPDKPEDSIEILHNLYHQAMPLYRENLNDFRMRLEKNVELPEFFDRNFSMKGQPWIKHARKEELV